VWSTKEGRRVRAAGSLLRWPAIGALIVGGGIIAAYIFGPKVARELGAAGGESFAEGVAKAQNQIAAITSGRGSRWS
jgi:fumarate hydratase class II